MMQESRNRLVGANKPKKKWLKISLIVVGILVVIGGIVFWRAGSLLNKVSLNSNILSSLVHAIPGVQDKLKGEDEGQINILLLGMRGADDPAGGTLADTIMVLSIRPADNKVAFLSIPRDLYVDNPNVGAKTKINAVHAYGEQDGKQKGIASMEEVVGNIIGAKIHYALVINFKGFRDLVDAIGGVQITLDQPFEEALQFNEEKVCDSYVFTQKTGKFEYKYQTTPSGRKRVVAQYPLCTNPNTECNGDFKLPAGTQTLDGKTALCYARSRKTSSDFERAKRQQLIIQSIKDRALSMGTLSDFGKVNGIFSALGENIKTDMEGWEMKRLYEIEQKMQSPQITQRVLENNEEGLLYNPPETPEAGYILLPIGDNYDRIRNMFSNIFILPSQSDAKPK